MKEIKTTSTNDLISRLKKDQALYERLTPDEKAEVDAFNLKIRTLGIKDILALGDHPFKRLRKKYGEKT